MQEKIADLLKDINGKDRISDFNMDLFEMICLIRWELRSWSQHWKKILTLKLIRRISCRKIFLPLMKLTL